MNKIRIESDGTSAGTVLYVDGKLVDNVQEVKFEAKLNKTLAKLNVVYQYPDALNIIEETTVGDK